MTYSPKDIDTTGRPAHPVYADYYVGTFAELGDGDGFRLVPLAGRGVPFDLVRPLLAVKVERFGGLTSVDLIDRASFVSGVTSGLTGLPVEGVCEVATTVVYGDTDPVLVRF